MIVRRNEQENYGLYSKFSVADCIATLSRRGGNWCCRRIAAVAPTEKADAIRCGLRAAYLLLPASILSDDLCGVPGTGHTSSSAPK